MNYNSDDFETLCESLYDLSRNSYKIYIEECLYGNIYSELGKEFKRVKRDITENVYNYTINEIIDNSIQNLINLKIFNVIHGISKDIELSPENETNQKILNCILEFMKKYT